MRWVVAQAILFSLILFLPFSQQFELPAALMKSLRAVSLVGFTILLRATYDLRKSLAIRPEPKENGRLQMSGIYGLIRHPMYLSVWLILAASAVSSGSYIKVAIFVLMVAFFVAKTRYEESQLKLKYPGYLAYTEKVGAYLPKLSAKQNKE